MTKKSYEPPTFTEHPIRHGWLVVSEGVKEYGIVPRPSTPNVPAARLTVWMATREEVVRSLTKREILAVYMNASEADKSCMVMRHDPGDARIGVLAMLETRQKLDLRQHIADLGSSLSQAIPRMLVQEYLGDKGVTRRKALSSATSTYIGVGVALLGAGSTQFSQLSEAAKPYVLFASLSGAGAIALAGHLPELWAASRVSRLAEEECFQIVASETVADITELCAPNSTPETIN